MRSLTEEETKIFFEKLAKYIGKNIPLLIQRTEEAYCFCLQKDRVYYVSERIMRRANNVSREHLCGLGICFGKFTKSGQFKLHITALETLAPYAQFKVWVKPNGEMPFLYGHHIPKNHLGRITEETPQYQGVIIYNMNDLPLGFGVTARSTQECRKVDPTTLVVFHQADIGEYLREEDTLI